MSSEYGATRWWEYYAVRYLMPSIAGMAIVIWICSHGGGKLRILLALPGGSGVDTASLTLMFLYGNLFCYIASYPALIFHATRVLDFQSDNWPGVSWLDGYLSSIAITMLAFVLTVVHEECRYWGAFLLVVVFAFIQLRRLYLVFSRRVTVRGCSGTDGNPGDVSYSYGYSYALARRRGKSLETETTRTRANSVPGDFDDDEEVQTNRRIVWHKEYIETYRHLREHGNSAIIFLLELGLAALVYCVITKPGQSSEQQLSAIGILFAIWAVPAIFTHLIAQYLERRFSHFDRRIGNNGNTTAQ